MISYQEQLVERDRALVGALLRWVPKEAQEVLSFSLSTRVTNLRETLRHFSQEKDSFSFPPQHHGVESLLYHADPAWITDAFRNEGPGVLAVLLADLPKAKIGGFLKDLPKNTRRALKEIQVGSIDPRLRLWIRQRAEHRFPQISLDFLQETALWAQVRDLSSDQKKRLFRELGFQEMTLALSRFSRTSIRLILNRLHPQDAKELRRRIKESVGLSPLEQREAQMHLLSSDLEKMSAEDILSEIGLGVFTRALTGGPAQWGTYFVYHLPPRYGYLLRRLLGSNAPDAQDEKRQRTMKRIETALAVLEED